MFRGVMKFITGPLLAFEYFGLDIRDGDWSSAIINLITQIGGYLLATGALFLTGSWQPEQVVLLAFILFWGLSVTSQQADNQTNWAAGAFLACTSAILGGLLAEWFSLNGLAYLIGHAVVVLIWAALLSSAWWNDPRRRAEEYREANRRG